MGDERVKNEAMEIMGLFQLLPRLVVFDLDYTLWPFYCECRSKRDMPRVYPHAKGILYALKDKGVKIAIASRSPTPDIANTFLDKLGIKSLFVAQEIFSSRTHKIDHFQRIKRRTNIPYTEMLFFDDEDRNIDAFEMQRGDVPKAVECYMNETGASIEEAREHVMGMLRETWMKTNEESFKDSPFSQDFIRSAADLGRQAQYMYQHGDGHGMSNPQMEERISTLMFQPIV